MGPITAVAQRVCLVNTPGGGHAVIGFYLAKELVSLGHQVTVLTACASETDKKMSKPPFNRFDELRAAGVSTVWGEAAAAGAATGGAAFDVVIDNNGKDMQGVQPVIDWAKSMGASQFLFVSSAGIYESTVTPPLTEADPVKFTSGHAEVERYAASQQSRHGMHFSSFRPQYIVGAGNNKDCEEYFFDRLVRGRPILIPGSGDQIVNIAHAGDNAHMIALAVGNPAAYGQIFNCVRDKGVTLDGLVHMCAAACGVKASIVHYDAKAKGVDAKKAFPFRTEYHFFSEPRAALMLLGWTPKNNLNIDLVERYREYRSSPRFSQLLAFDKDDDILAKL